MIFLQKWVFNVQVIGYTVGLFVVYQLYFVQWLSLLAVERVSCCVTPTSLFLQISIWLLVFLFLGDSCLFVIHQLYLQYSWLIAVQISIFVLVGYLLYKLAYLRYSWLFAV